MVNMDDTSMGFKTQWLNETLKFLKNDQELIYRYPEWPISRVKFYHTLIAERQLSAGLGFKTLHAPLWEAMRVYGLKYTFKVTIIVNSKDEEKGCLVLEKIPKKTEEDNEIDSDEEICEHKLTKKNKQAYLLNKAIVERNSPTFIKNTLQSLLGFVSDEASASMVLKDLAPIEAKFIQNIQAIHDHKFLFYKIFSPSSIEILKKISKSLSLKNTYNIQIGNVRTHPKTAKKEIILTKVPNFDNHPSIASSLSQTTTSSTLPTMERSKSKERSSPAPLRSPKSMNPKPIASFESSEDDSSKTKKDTDKQTLTCKAREEKNKDKDKEKKKVIENKIVRPAKSRLINIEDNSENETRKENTNTEIKIDCKISNKSKEVNNLILTENARKGTTTAGKVNGKAKQCLPADMPALTRSGQKKAIMEAMSKPLESDKGMRMMKLMGWEGGALGIRGDGITEPIMPALHLKPKAGLGAPVIKICNKENTTVPKTKKGAIDTKSCVTSLQFLEGAYEALVNGKSTIRFKNSLNTKQVKFFINNIVQLNRRARVSHNNDREKIMVDKIWDKLTQVPGRMFDYSFMHNHSELCLQVTDKTVGVSVPQPSPAPKPGADTELPERLLDIEKYLRAAAGKPKRSKTTLYKLSVKLYTLVTVADFTRSNDLDMSMDFSFGYCKKVYKYMQRICDVLNEGKMTKKIKSTEEVSVLNEISGHLKNQFLSVHLCSPLVTVRKLKLSTKHRPIIDYNQLCNVPRNDNSKCMNGASDSESDSENKSKINNSTKNMITEPSKGKKPDVAINLNENAQQLLENAQQLHENAQQLLENAQQLPENTQQLPEHPQQLPENAPQLPENAQKLPENAQQLPENAQHLPENAQQLPENEKPDPTTLIFNFDIEKVAEAKLPDLDEQKKDNSVLESPQGGKPTDIKYKDKCIDLIKESFNKIDLNDNILNSDRPSEINLTNNCDTSSSKNSININSDMEKDFIDIVRYKGHSIVKIVVKDLEDVNNLSRKVQESLINCDYFHGDNYLKCHGVHNGGLVYYYSNKDWFEDVLSNNFDVLYHVKAIEKFVMKVHINCFINVEDVLKALEVHNRGLCTADWTVIEEGNCYFVVDVDCDSFRFVCGRRFSLFAGVDTALFTLVL